MKKVILVTGATGLVGTDLVEELRKDSSNTVISTDIEGKPDYILDIRNQKDLHQLFHQYQFNRIYHLAGILSVGSEKNPDLAWEVNFGGLKNILDIAKNLPCRVFWPSSIAVFGPSSPKINTPQHTVLEPSTIYGTAKVAGELLCQYYFLKYGLDVRSLRYPGLIAWKSPPGDGTTEYSVHIFHQILKTGSYSCFLKPDTRLPMMYIDDAIKGTIKLLESDPKNISLRTAYNFSAINFSPAELFSEIQKIIPDSICTYSPDYRQAIADSWPQSVDDRQAETDWGWIPEFDLSKLVTTMIANLRPIYV